MLCTLLDETIFEMIAKILKKYKKMLITRNLAFPTPFLNAISFLCCEITIFFLIHYCIKRTLPVRHKHVLTGKNRALTGENVY